VSHAPNSRQFAGDVEVSIIVVTHGAREMTLSCLESLAARAGDVHSEVIIVDNASPDGLAGEVAIRHPDFRVFRQVANIGFAAAANVGADRARGRNLLLLNPDTVMPEGALTRLFEAARHTQNAGLWGARTSFADGRPNPTCCRRKPTLWRLLCSGLALDTRFPHARALSGMAYPDLPDRGMFAVAVICGVCLLIQRSVWDRLAGFSPAFFMYGEDEDLSLRARQLGFSPTLASDVAIVHHGSGTEPNQERKLCHIFAARSLIVGGYFAVPVRQIAYALLLLRPFLGSYFSRRELRPMWKKVWARRRRWLAGHFS
jgi:N-acetylglucosaminyl-diphospho-decaprenol L-rhamnosyltransferase